MAKESPVVFGGHNWVYLDAAVWWKPTRKRFMQCTRCGELFWEWEVAAMFESQGKLCQCDNFNAGRYGYEPVTGR